MPRGGSVAAQMLAVMDGGVRPGTRDKVIQVSFMTIVKVLIILVGNVNSGHTPGRQCSHRHPKDDEVHEELKLSTYPVLEIEFFSELQPHLKLFFKITH